MGASVSSPSDDEGQRQPHRQEVAIETNKPRSPSMTRSSHSNNVHGAINSHSSPVTSICSTGGHSNRKMMRNESAGEVVSQKRQLPHNCESILRDSDLSVVDKSSTEKLYERLYTGVFLDGRKKKYWVEKKGNTNINCFKVFASSLHITWGEDSRYWRWCLTNTSDGEISIAELMNVCWLEVHGRFNTTNLTPNVTYEVVYEVMIKDTSYGLEVPVNVRLTLPNGSKQEHKEHLMKNPNGEWVKIPVGEFKIPSGNNSNNNNNNDGEIEFSMYEYDAGFWKKGLVIKGATIQPKI